MQLIELLGPIPPAEFLSNGCSCAPDSIGSVDLKPACRYHDYAYNKRYPRWFADYCFYGNLRILGCPRHLAMLYWVSVRVFGIFFYPKNNN